MPDAESYYSLEPARVLRRIPPPFGPQRLEMIRTLPPEARARFGPDGPTAMLLEWGCQGLRITATKLSSVAGAAFRFIDIGERVLNTHGWEWEGDHALMTHNVTGDVVTRSNASQDECLDGLNRLAAELWPGENVKLTLRHVRRQVKVLSGTWHFKPRDSYAESRGRIELVHHELDADRQRLGECSGSIADFADALSRHSGAQVCVEAELAPAEILWCENSFPGRGTAPQVRRVPFMVLQNVEEQCGLELSDGFRTVRRVFIEAA